MKSKIVKRDWSLNIQRDWKSRIEGEMQRTLFKDNKYKRVDCSSREMKK